jgi:bla regulator protein BlaR1
MEAFCYYLLKSSFILLLFFVCYHLLLRKETLFKFNRCFLLVGLLVSLLLPSIYITNFIDIPLLNWTNTTNLGISNIEQPLINWISPFTILIIIYASGLCIFLYKLIHQTIQLKKLIQYGTTENIRKPNHIITKEQLAPFSFFHYIIYNPNIHTKQELETILAHEEVHVKQKHSFDIILIELFLTLQWFNPIAWFYRTAIKQNLEFLADNDNSQILQNKKAYQYTLLQQVLSNHQLSIINPFFNSLIKKRIVMINQQKSKKVNALKSLYILPLLALFLLSFNTRDIYKSGSINQTINTKNIVEAVIDKNTTDSELLKIKVYLANNNFDLSYTVVRNKNQEIQNLSLQISGGNKTKGEVSSRFNTVSDNDTIDPTYILIDTDMNSISIKSANQKATNSKSSKELKNKQVSISSSTSKDYDIKIVEDEKSEFKFSTNEDTKEPLYFLDGIKSDSETVKKLDTSTIASMNVVKGESAKQKYGEEGKNGVIEIITKK